MTSKLKCPFCKEEIISDLCLMCDKIDKGYTSGRQTYKCNKCSLFGNKELWQALIQAKQDLEIATKALKEIQTAQGRCWGATDTEIKNDCKYYAYKALEQITHDNKSVIN